MRKLSEVCKIVGVTRRVLQGYEKAGLLPPTKRTESNYWLYDDAAIDKLAIIQIFREAGYARAEIKDMFESSPQNLDASLDSLILHLEEKRKRIGGTIELVKAYKLSMKFAREVMGDVKPEDMLKAIGENNFKDCWDKSIAIASESSDDDRIDYEVFTTFMMQLLRIGYMSEKPVESKEVEDSVDLLLDYFEKVVENIYGDSDNINDKEFKEIWEFFNELVDEALSIPESTAILRMSGDSEKAISYIKKAIKYYCKGVNQ